MENGHILYPCYFDATIKRRSGRRVPKTLASDKPTIHDIEEALSRLHLSYTRENKSHPAFWWRHDGRLIVPFKGSKNELIRSVAAGIDVKKAGIQKSRKR
ncbi:MAG: signal recognition particle subunit SRP19/SEC65 family protein [Methanospirillaceae archaeon]|nr:signal recognition particle subunit SRP19/SEC65 family protein [Methanospirillaceae archaeon]